MFTGLVQRIGTVKRVSRGAGLVVEIAADNNLAEAWRLTPSGTVKLIRLAVVFHGEELLLAEEI